MSQSKWFCAQHRAQNVCDPAAQNCLLKNEQRIPVEIKGSPAHQKA